MVLADGCGWGSRSRAAAKSAVEHVCHSMESEISNFTDLQEVARCLLLAMYEADASIWDGVKKAWEVGTTTLLIGMLVKTVQEKEEEKGNFEGAPYVLISLNIGDCKTFIIRKFDEKDIDAIDMTVESKRTARDKTDPGGRLGPYENNAADVRNLTLSTIGIWPGDYICLVSDGVHDNLDPETLGKSLEFSIRRNADLAKELLDLKVDKETEDIIIPPEYEDNVGWEKIALLNGELLKTEYREYSMARFMVDNAISNPAQLVDILFEHCKKTTKAARDYMEANANQRHPPDYVEFPGKMDHTSAIVYRLPTASSSQASSSPKKAGKNDANADYEAAENVEIVPDSAETSVWAPKQRLTRRMDPKDPHWETLTFEIRKEAPLEGLTPRITEDTSAGQKAPRRKMSSAMVASS